MRSHDPLSDRMKTDLHKRFRPSGRNVLFKSAISMRGTAIGDQHYNKWYVIATIPEDLSVMDYWEAVAIAFIRRGHVPFKTEDEVRTEALSYAVAG